MSLLILPPSFPGEVYMRLSSEAPFWKYKVVIVNVGSIIWLWPMVKEHLSRLIMSQQDSLNPVFVELRALVQRRHIYSN